MGGLLSSEPKITRTDVEQLKLRFQEMSDYLDKTLPWINFLRNGGVAMNILGAVNLFLESVTLGGNVATQLISVGLVMQVIGSVILREFGVIRNTHNLRNEFSKLVPAYMDTSHIPKPSADDNLYCIHMLGIFHLVLCLSITGFSFGCLLVSVLLLVSNAVILLKIIKDRNDQHLKTICHLCSETLKAVLRANADP